MPDPLEELLVGQILEMRWSRTEGRHLVCSRDIEKDEVVLVAQPFATTMYFDGNENSANIAAHRRWCLGCARFRQAAALAVHCNCCGASFCGARCRIRAESLGVHSPMECKAVAELQAKAMSCDDEDDTAREEQRDTFAGAALLVRIACRAASEAAVASVGSETDSTAASSHPGGGSSEPSFRHVEALAPLPPTLPELVAPEEATNSAALQIFERWQRDSAAEVENAAICRLAASALQAAGWSNVEGVGPLKGLGAEGAQGLELALLRIQSRVLCNCFGLSANSPDGAEVGPEEGWGVWPAASLFNHSCVPSLYIEFSGRAQDRGRIAFRALRHIKAGSELSIAYGRSAGRQSREARRVVMREHWRFDCGCARCRYDDGGVPEEDYEAFDAEFRCRRCNRIGPARPGGYDEKGGLRSKGCSCVRAKNRLAG
mmetsp:Transcript_57738/g.122822  ORF Transcript_57738/g.122822 Transcript_57738/m.122822 type:complete len:431 (-) Transcript_57738:94-1386(-)